LLARFVHYAATKDEREQPTQHFDTPLAEVQPITTASLAIQNYEEMVTKSSQLITKYPDDVAAYSDRGGAYILIKQYDEALVDLNKAIELKPYYADALNNRGLLLCARGEFKQALNDLNYAVERIPTEMAYYINRGTCYRKMGDHLHAGVDFDYALNMSSKLIRIANQINISQKAIQNPHISTKNEARTLFFKVSVILVKYIGSDYPHVI
jgi:tetratricopeptide (TPR) repeat protein